MTAEEPSWEYSCKEGLVKGIRNIIQLGARSFYHVIPLLLSNVDIYHIALVLTKVQGDFSPFKSPIPWAVVSFEWPRGLREFSLDKALIDSTL